MHYGRQYFFIFFTLIFGSYLLGNEPIEVLENRLNAADRDTLKIDILLKMGDHYEKSDYDLALKYFNQAMELCSNTNHSNLSRLHLNHLKELEWKSLRRIASLQISWGYYQEATESNRKLLNIYRGNNDIKEIIYTLMNLASIHYYQSQWSEALKLYQEALEFAQNNNIPGRIADLKNNIANVHYSRGDYVKSMKDFQTALSIYDSLADYTNVGKVLLGIGNIFSVTNNYNKALESYQSALKHLEKTEDHQKLAAVYTSLGALHHENENYEEAEKYYLLTIEKAKLMNDQFQLSNGLVNMAILCGARNQINEAMIYLDQVLEIATRTSNKYIENVALRNKAVNNAKMGNYPLAMKFAKESLGIAKQIESIDDQAEGYRTLSDISQKMGKYSEALQYYQQYKAMNDSLLNIDTKRQLNEMDAIYQSEKQEQKIELQNLEIDKNKAEIKRKNQLVTIIIATMVLLVILTSLVLFFNTKEKMKNQDITRQRQIIINNMNKIKNLQSTIENQNEQINKLENHNKSWKLKISDHQLFARNLLITTTDYENELQSIFPAKSFTYPDTELGVPIDIGYIRKFNNEILMVFADLQMNKLNKTMVNLAINAFLDQLLLIKTCIHPLDLHPKLREFIQKLTNIQRLPSPIIKLAAICIDTQTQKIKIAAEHISVYVAINRNSQSIFNPIHDYHELQRLATSLEPNNAENNAALTGAKEFKFKTTDRIYIINSGISLPTDIEKEYENPIEAGIVRIIDTHQNMGIDLQGQYLKKELRIISTREKNLVPGILSIRGIEL
jgi:tetratricopeptide (TPR) repeat protein